MKSIPYLGVLLLGQNKEPFSLNNMTSRKYVTFLERASIDTFTEEYSTGVMFHNYIGKRLTYALGGFKQSDSQGLAIGDDNWGFTGRLTGLPIYSRGGRTLLHLGAAYRYQNPEGNTVRYRARPEHHLAPRFLDTRDPLTGVDIQSNGVQNIGGEVAMVLGSFSMQAEYVATFIEVLPFVSNTIARFPFAGGGDAFFQGAYLFASYFLTGEHRPYRTTQGSFGRIRPRRRFLDGKGGTGAIEIGARYSFLDLQDGPFNPNSVNPIMPAASFGTMHNYTGVINWYLNPYTRISTNFTLSDPDPNGLAYLWSTRFQIAF